MEYKVPRSALRPYLQKLPKWVIYVHSIVGLLTVGVVLALYDAAVLWVGDIKEELSDLGNLEDL